MRRLRSGSVRARVTLKTSLDYAMNGNVLGHDMLTRDTDLDIPMTHSKTWLTS